MTTLIIPDIHGKVDLLRSILDEHASSADRVIQVGDLASCVSSTVHGDISCLRLMAGLQQRQPLKYTILVGNHELPYFGRDCPAFSGFGRFPEVEVELRRIDWRVASVAEGNLISHAGVHPHIVAQYYAGDCTPEMLASDLNGAFIEDASLPVFSQIGPRRGGSSQYGGIFWRDFEEDSFQGFPQIFGHSKSSDVRVDGTSFCIDCERPFLLPDAPVNGAGQNLVNVPLGPQGG